MLTSCDVFVGFFVALWWSAVPARNVARMLAGCSRARCQTNTTKRKRKTTKKA
jgi:hypothetical protein